MKTVRLLSSAIIVGGTAVLVLLALLSVQSNAHASGPDQIEVYYVAQVCDGTSIPCYTSLQDAVDAVDHPSDIVKVAAGVFSELVTRPAPPGYANAPVSGITQVVFITKSLTIRGGYTTTNAFADPPDPSRYLVVLDAQGQGRPLVAAGAISVTLEGLHLTGGNPWGLGGGVSTREDGGGGAHIVGVTITMRNNHIYSNVVQPGDAEGAGLLLGNCHAFLDGNLIEHNDAGNSGTAGNGGGLFIYQSEAILEDNVFRENGAEAGGGLLAYGPLDLHPGLILRNNTFIGNVGYGGGAGLGVSREDALLIGNTVIGNSTHVPLSGGPGGMYLGFAAFTVTGNIIVSNSTTGCGGGVQVRGETTLVNNIIANNRADLCGGGVTVWDTQLIGVHNTIVGNGDVGLYVGVTDPSSVVLTNTILLSHTTGVYVNRGTASLEATLWGSGAWGNVADWDGGMVSTGTINLWEDPAFVNPVQRDYHIGSGSYARDAGVQTSVLVDLDCEPRVGVPDIGADEFVLCVYLPLALQR